MARKDHTLSFTLEIDSYAFQKDLDKMDYKTRQKVLKQILRNTQRKVMVPALKAEAPVGRTGNLYKSMGIVAGKKKSEAWMFAGPRMSTGHKRNPGLHKGWVANILENWKDPGKQKTNFRWVIRHNLKRADREIFLSMQNVFAKL